MTLFFCDCLTVVATASLKTTFTQMQNDYIYFYIYCGLKQGALGRNCSFRFTVVASGFVLIFY